MHIHFISTGGTIDKLYFDAKSEYQIGSPQVKFLLEEWKPDFTYVVEALLAKDSLEITDADRELIRARVLASPSHKIVITHGTDTMIETALHLQDLPGKTIVLTGAMQPARFHSTDAIFNLGTAIGAVHHLPLGVHIAMHGCIFDPLRTRKNRELGRFENI
jgi:L-asparaginase